MVIAPLNVYLDGDSIVELNKISSIVMELIVISEYKIKSIHIKGVHYVHKL